LVRLLTIVCLILLAVNCGDDGQRVTAPTRVINPGGFTLSGVVTERFSGRPVEGAEVVAHPGQGHHGIWYWQGGVSNAAGRYTINWLFPNWVDFAYGARLAASHDGYVQQCVATVTLQGDATVDLTVSSVADLAALNVPIAATPPDSRTVSGTVFEMTATGRQPVENASVGLDHGMGNGWVAETRSDAAGRYLLCGMPEVRITGLLAGKAGYNFAVFSVDPGSHAVVDVEITRK
jgi:alkanesulfonate monooxygenase SsuD/methylene tetrahydromethanopterin reductase-like flavin-dependent oxidoreductase (luciferase family)